MESHQQSIELPCTDLRVQRGILHNGQTARCIAQRCSPRIGTAVGCDTCKAQMRLSLAAFSAAWAELEAAISCSNHTCCCMPPEVNAFHAVFMHQLMMWLQRHKLVPTCQERLHSGRTHRFGLPNDRNVYAANGPAVRHQHMHVQKRSCVCLHTMTSLRSYRGTKNG